MTDFDPSHLQNISNILFDNENYLECEISCEMSNQCIYRSIINRSYYAAFSYFKIWAIQNKGYDEDNALNHYRNISRGRAPGRHKVLTLFIVENLDPNYEQNIIDLANKLDSIREQRTGADYYFDIELSKTDAEEVFNISQEIISSL
ncbi:hypothetical protein MBBAR_10c00210 [Methanobrevibacter arboriphilus JCM 13429 = DSM 1125]|uniref:HEPN domain-containing protein n=1 Tax=Methanobrevibacter arboriphilus JCM 13429 = DSM 1125 TaxID=1300164 RepID=A0A1V6N1T5_METAZ|nr:hypothetical protein [Methanobrevibacter arboriphilus]OQD58680.1 hypothetical protein MBBAR_10c00210 [Methanobrevibacter arboriphilus JCM 13429 = DSM 1125]